jgi:release factor glutamine methyltransferase
MIDGLVTQGADALREAGVQTARLDAELLLQHTLGLNRSEFLTLGNVELSAAERDTYFSLIERRCAREPLQYITGEAAFRNLVLRVTPDVLIPRPETELVVGEVIFAVKHMNNPKILDIGTGSGAIAIAVASEVPEAEVVATDISNAAVALAIENAETAGVTDRIRFLVSNYFGSLPAEYEESFNVVVSNPPYVLVSEMPGLMPEVRDYEPAIALTPGRESLEPHRKIAAEAPRFLKTGGLLVLEVGAGTGDGGKEALIATGHYREIELILDLAGQDRIVKGVLK